MAERYRIADRHELSEDGDSVINEVNGQEVAVFNVRGEFHAVLNFCVHQSGPLCEGPLGGRMKIGADGWSWSYEDENEVITCPWHNWKFNVTTGENIKDSRYTVPTFEVESDENHVYVRM